MSALVGSRPPAAKPLGEDPDEGEEAALVARAQYDREAFATLYARYAERVYRYCYRRLDNPEAAADAMADVFIKVLDALPRFRGGSFRAWLFAIANFTVADAYRGRRPVEPLDAAAETPDPSPRPDDVAIDAAERRALRALIGTLPPDQRDVIDLRLAGLTGPEIAEVLQRSLPSVKSSQYRAFVRLRWLLGVTPPPKDGRDGT